MQSYAERAVMKRPAKIKPCLVGIDGRGATKHDLSRIVAVACSNAGPYERCVVSCNGSDGLRFDFERGRVDIKLSRMSH